VTRSAAARIALLAAAALLLAACGLTRLAYNNVTALYSNAAPMLTWMVDDYVDISGPQKEWVRDHLARALAWHRRQELPEYRRFLERVADRFEGGFTVEEVDQSYGEMRVHYRKAVEHLLPDVADFLLQLDAEQATQLEHKFDDDNRKLLKDSVKGSVDERLRDRLKTLLGHIEQWTGTLSEPQRRIVEDYLRSMPATESERLADRRYRQAETLALVRAKPTRAEAVSELHRLLIDTETWRRPEYQEKLRRRDALMYRMVSELSLALTPQQRAYLVGRLRGYIRDISTLATTG
jgi:hypothetical protein